MELGYTGIAYNRTIKGVMSESDRCCIPLFPLSSILKLAPSLSTSIEFHRNLLNVPVSTAFRQYTRLTVMVDSSAQASALNSGNPILKSYDVVAVRPLNQNAFEQACLTSEVGIIAIDFSEKLPFRLKQSMVKAAIERGVFFEITYSSLILDVHMRRQMISNAKLLVDWTRGKNLLFSSAAPSVTELRGPYDVANLASLLGLPLERAKAALSKNCRSVISNALRKKHYHKEAIKIDLITSGAKEPEFDDWLKWDPISSGEGDLLLDDIKKSFSVSRNVSKNVKPIDFGCVVNNLPSHGLQIRDLMSSTVLRKEPLGTTPELAGVQEDEVALTTTVILEQPGGVSFLPEECPSTEHDTLNIQQNSGFEEFRMPCLSVAHLNDVHDEEKEKGNSVIDNGEMENTNKLEIKDTFETKIHDFQAETCSVSYEEYAVLPGSATTYTCKRETEVAPCADSSSSDVFIPLKDENCVGLSGQNLGTSDRDLHAQNGAVDGVFIEAQLNNNQAEKEQFREMRCDSNTLANGSSNNELSNPMEVDNEFLVAANVPVKDDPVGELRQTGNDVERSYQIMGGSRSGNRKHRASYLPALFPFKRLLSHRPAKRKTQRLNQFSNL